MNPRIVDAAREHLFPFFGPVYKPGTEIEGGHFALFVNLKPVRATVGTTRNRDRLQIVPAHLGARSRYSVQTWSGARIAQGYTNDEEKGPDGFVRSHSPEAQAPALRGTGFGLLLYSAMAVGSAREKHIDGIFSIEGNRSSAAERFWGRLVESGLAEEEQVENEQTEEDSEQHCERIRDHDAGDGGTILDDEVCGEVTVRRITGDNVTATTLRARDVMMQPFFIATLNALGEAGEVEAAARAPNEPREGTPEERTDGLPPDLAVRAALPENLASAALKDWAGRYAAFLSDAYDAEVARTFMQRIDVAELFGQAKFPGIGRGFGAITAMFGAAGDGLPPLSARSRKMLDLFAKLT